MSSSRPFAGLEPVALSSATRDQVLLRAATDHFILAHSHEPSAIRQYEELAIHYLPRTTIADRVYVSERLAVRKDAPASVVRLLARDIIAVAAPVLLRSKVLSTLDLLMVISGTGPEHHRLLAQRDTLPDEVLTALRLKNELGTLNILRARGFLAETPSGEKPAPSQRAARSHDPNEISEPATPAIDTRRTDMAKVDAALAKAIAAEINRAETSNVRADAGHKSDSVPRSEQTPATKAPGDAFLALDRAGRLKIIAETAGGRLASAHWSSPRKLERLVKTTFRRSQIQGLVRGRKRAELIEALSDGLGLSAGFVTACLDDRSGEPMVLLARAMGLNQADGKDLLLLANPVIGLSIPDFIRLADLHDAMEPEVAETIVAGWRGEAVTGPQHLGTVSNAAGARRHAGAAREGAKQTEGGAGRSKASA